MHVTIEPDAAEPADPIEELAGVALAVWNGARVVRAHDEVAARRACDVVIAILEAE